MVLTLCVWLCTLPLVLLLIAPWLGARIAVVTALVLLVVIGVAKCWWIRRRRSMSRGFASMSEPAWISGVAPGLPLNVLGLNCGSSLVKFQLVALEPNVADATSHLRALVIAADEELLIVPDTAGSDWASAAATGGSHPVATSSMPTTL